MRAHAIPLSVILLLSPLAAGISLPTPAAPLAAGFPLLPEDLPDAQLMLMLARLDHPGVRLVPRALPAADDTLAAAVTRVGAAAGVTLPTEDAVRFAALDARVQAPLLTLFVAIEQANGMIAQAWADVPEGSLERMHALREAGMENSPEFRSLVEPIDMEMLINAGILVTDTVESVVVPALQDAVAAGAWPASGAWDRVGVLRLGSTGDDYEALDRIVQIDPSGDDHYQNNAGGSTVVDPFYGSFNILTPVAVSIDFSGNDLYHSAHKLGASQGGSELGTGFGLLLDDSGDDLYHCASDCQGGGFGVSHDRAGVDRRGSVTLSMGYGFPLGILREDGGADIYALRIYTAGYAGMSGMLGLLWDRAGADYYGTNGAAYDRVGWGDGDGRGYFVDEGPEIDYYQTAEWPTEPDRHGCNDCTWERGSTLAMARPGGQGNDNAGGLAYLLSMQDPLLGDL